MQIADVAELIEYDIDKGLLSTVGVGRFVIDVSLISLVGRVRYPHNLGGLDVPDLRHLLQVLFRCREHGADGSESLEEAAGEGLADARKSFDDKPLPLFERHRPRLVSQTAICGSPVLALPEDARDERSLFPDRRRQDGDPFGRLEDEEGA